MESDRPIRRHDSSLSADQQLHEAVRRVFQLSGYREIAALDCEVNSHVIILRGVLPSFYLKQVAQTLVRRLEQVAAIDDRIEVL